MADSAEKSSKMAEDIRVKSTSEASKSSDGVTRAKELRVLGIQRILVDAGGQPRQHEQTRRGSVVTFEEVQKSRGRQQNKSVSSDSLIMKSRLLLCFQVQVGKIPSLEHLHLVVPPFGAGGGEADGDGVGIAVRRGRLGNPETEEFLGPQEEDLPERELEAAGGGGRGDAQVRLLQRP